MDKLKKLKPRLRRLAQELMAQARTAGIEIIITQGWRSFAEQDKLYGQGRTQPGKIVTNCRGGDSFHNYGVAFDFCPLDQGRADWNNAAVFRKVGAIGRELGLEWGGDWKKFPDRPHFQYTAGHTLDDFKNNKIDELLFV